MVVICLKIRTFVVSATTGSNRTLSWILLWFAWKFVPLWYQQQRVGFGMFPNIGCDLLENSYLCGISNNEVSDNALLMDVVICLKIRTFVVSATTISCESFCNSLLWFAWKFVPLWYQQQHSVPQAPRFGRCDLLENSYLCGISNNRLVFFPYSQHVVICLKIRTFVVSATTITHDTYRCTRLWFAWKFVPLWYQQQH